MKFQIYKILTLYLPPYLLTHLRNLSQLTLLKRWLMGSSNAPTLAEGEIYWEDISFFFAAPSKVFLQAQMRGIENCICRLARKAILDSPTQTVIDVGANYGFVSLVMGKSINTQSRLISVEAEPAISKVLTKTLARNGLQHRTRIVTAKAGSKVGDGQVSLDSLVCGQPIPPIGFIKIDVDGADYQVLVGAENLLKEYTPIVVIEMTAHQLAIYEKLKALGYQYFMDQNNQTVIPNVWPENLIASVKPITIPEHFSK